jgi:hypothetical protein
MGAILDDIIKCAKWQGQNVLSSNGLWADEIEKWLEYIKNKYWFDKYKPRLTKQAKEKLWEALSEISSMYFLEQIHKLSVKQLKPSGRNNKEGDFLLGINGISIFCEVKSPGWEADVVRDEGPNSHRLKQPKYINAEVRWIDNSVAIRNAVDKAYEKLPDNIPSLLIINPDLWWVGWGDEIKVNNMPLFIDRALYYEPLNPPYTDSRPKGCFMTKEYERLSAVLFLDITASGNKIEYKKIWALNNNAVCPLPSPLRLCGDN